MSEIEVVAAKDELEVKHQMMTLLERLLLIETLLYHMGHYLLQSQRALGNQEVLTESQDSARYWLLARKFGEHGSDRASLKNTLVSVDSVLSDEFEARATKEEELLGALKLADARSFRRLETRKRGVRIRS